MRKGRKTMDAYELLKFGFIKPERPTFSNTDLSPHLDALFHRTINFWMPQKILRDIRKRKSQRNCYTHHSK